ncbi:TfoX/Sxy family protein [Vitiosangium sp. GDMCC 1.1324]|uniref:TfoX/Sxy family protein n=1 Tax=Vitiosangium sp. (strain GDMCC 1.1324) TaxID=2138576 RepID=UPI000D3D02B1|nr:TfoX/Sxy family protein [Vitiosangium sp. GDMCC 1.1324]PTL83131.1 competence protein TfoX [Vitiosangium sp. GDMCC 1.1324]
MARMDSFVEYTLELLEPLGPVQARAMFGGWGLYSSGRMFGLIIQDRLYLKTDDTTRSAFESAGGEPFVYDSGRGKPVTMSYWTPPPDASDDAHLLLPWARRAVDASLRAAQKKPAAKKSAPTKKPPAAKKPAPAKAKSTPAKKQARAKKPAAKKAPAPVKKKTARPSRRA